MVLLLSIISLAVSCSFGILPAFNQDRNSTQVSITLGSPVSAHAGDNGRAIIRGNGYLYIQTELAAANAVLHGPYQFSAGKTLTVSDIPAGTYANLLVIVVPAVPVAFSAVVSSDSTLVGVRSALLASLSAQTGILSSSSFGLVPNVTIIAGSTNQISATLVPATALAPDASGNVNLGGKAGEVNRFFVSLPNLKASFGGAQPSATTLLGCTVINASASAATISAFGLYDVTGKQLSLDTTESQLAVGGSDPYSAAWAGDDQLYLYIEFTGDSIQLNCTTSIKASTHTITYLANDGTGANIIRTLIDGSTGLLEKNTFTQTGYTFLGWTTIPGSTIVQFADGASYTMPGSDVTFYAVWKISSTPVSRTLSYDASGGTGTMVSRSVAEGTSLSLDMNSFTRVGYTFLGWSSIAGSTTIQYGNGALLSMPGSDLTLYAVWQANTTGANRIIGYDPNGGTGSMTSRTIAEGTTISLDANIFTRTGFGFLGWTTIPAGTTVQYSDSASYTVGSTNQIFYAVWAPKTHNVSFIANGGINTMPNQTIQEGISAALNTHTFSRAGYAFLGWATSSGATTPTYTEGGSFIMGNSDVTLYAVWNQNATHTISYDANGGTGTIPSQTNAEGMSVSLSANAFTRSGYTFLGWATSNTATLAQYAPGSTYTVGSINITFYAVWQSTVTVITHTITYNVNGGTGSMAAKTVNEGSAVSLDANLFTRSGYTFVGWNISAGSGTVLYGDGASYTMGTADVTLYAVWAAYRTISYDTNGGNGTMGSLTAADGDLITLGPNTFTRSGYSFLGWTSIPAGATVQYSDGASYTVGSANQIFYAVWAIKTHDVYFNANGGINTMPNQTIQEGLSAALNTHTFSLAGHTFLGWSTNSSATTPTYFEGGSFIMGISDVTLYAVWNIIATHTISYDPNGGNGTMASLTAADGSSITLGPNTFARTGYGFLGWTTIPAGVTVQYSDGASYTLGSMNQIFYAVWAPKTHDVYFNANGGINTMPNQTIQEGSSVGLNTHIFTRAGYTFLGWATSSGATTAAYPDGSFLTMGISDVTLYAIWSDVSPAVLTSTSINAESIYAGSTTVSLETHYSVDGSGIQQINLNGDIASLSSATVLINGSPVPVTPAGNNLMLTTVNTQPGSSITVDGIVLTSLEGTKSLSISLTDASGHTSNTVSDSIILDTANPSVTAVLLKNTATGNQNYTNTTAVDLCFTLGTDASGITSLRIDGSNFAGFSSPTVQVNGTTVGSSCIPWTITLDTALTSGGLIRISGISVDPGDGLKNIMVFATDASGKFSSGSANIALDTLPPPIPSVTVVSGAYPNGPVTNGNTEYIGPSATFTLYSSGSSNFKVNSTLLGSTMLTLTDSTSQTVVAVDAAGNMSTPFTFNVTQDSMPPLITSVDIEPSTGNLTVNFDNVGGPFGVLPSYVVEESGNSSSNNGYIGAGYSPFTSGPMTSSASTLSISGLAGLVSVYYDYVKIILTDAVGNQSAPYYVERCFTGTYTITATSP